MNFDLGSIIGTVSGFFVSIQSVIYGAMGLSSETGNGLLNFWRLFEAGLVFLANLFTKLFSGLGG